MVLVYKSYKCFTGAFLHQGNYFLEVEKEFSTVKFVKFRHYKRQFFTTSFKKSKSELNNISHSLKPQNAEQLLAEVKNVPENPFTANLLVKPFLFTVAFSSASLAITAIWQYENIRKKAVHLMKKSWFNEKMLKYEKKKYSWRQELNKLWNQLSEGQKLFAPICFLNVLVFLAWKVNRFQPVMIKYFCSTPFGEAVCWPMILTTFSHYSVLHLATNMYVLHSFSTGAADVLGKEQFLGLYLSAGVISSFTSYLYKALRSQHSLSIGASGAIMAVVAYICAKYPDTELSIILLPWVVFSAGSGIKFIMGLDVLGVLRGWKFFDHAAHLGGAFCGMGWCFWGNTYIWQRREPLLHWWHELRSASK